MNQIFQNMTKGEWNVEQHRDSGHYYITSGIFGLIADSFGHESADKANMEGIVMMHRETIGKGINPESVEKMKEALGKISNWLVCAAITTPEDMAESFGEMLQTSEEALTASKL